AVVAALEQKYVRRRFGYVADPGDLSWSFIQRRSLLLRFIERLFLRLELFAELLLRGHRLGRGPEALDQHVIDAETPMPAVFKPETPVRQILGGQFQRLAVGEKIDEVFELEFVLLQVRDPHAVVVSRFVTCRADLTNLFGIGAGVIEIDGARPARMSVDEN